MTSNKLQREVDFYTEANSQTEWKIEFAFSE